MSEARPKRERRPTQRVLSNIETSFELEEQTAPSRKQQQQQQQQQTGRKRKAGSLQSHDLQLSVSESEFECDEADADSDSSDDQKARRWTGRPGRSTKPKTGLSAAALPRARVSVARYVIALV